METQAPYFTDEEKAAVSDFLAYAVRPPVEFTPKAFEVLPVEKRPVFIIQELNGETEGIFYTLYASIDKDNPAAVLGAYIKAGLKGMINFRTADGQPVEFAVGADGYVSDTVLAAMNIHIRTAIKAVVLGGKD